jgi:response regulator RpfG family c-di-GMP phosphodiesterase
MYKSPSKSMTNPLIFYIDDDLDDLQAFAEAVGSIAKVALFERGTEMIHALQHNPEKPAVVFVDLNMPMKSGYEIIQEIKDKEELKDMIIVVLSTASDNISVTRSRDLGANYFIQKPTTLRKLRKAIEHTLGIDWKKFKPTYGEFIHKHS